MQGNSSAPPVQLRPRVKNGIISSEAQEGCVSTRPVVCECVSVCVRKRSCMSVWLLLRSLSLHRNLSFLLYFLLKNVFIECIGVMSVNKII